MLGKTLIADLKNGEEKTIELDPKEEFLSAKIQWCGSKPIKLSDLGSQKTFEIKGNAFLNQKMPLMGSIIPLLGLTFSINSGNEVLKYSGIGLIVLFVLFVIGTLSIWKNKWLLISKTPE